MEKSLNGMEIILDKCEIILDRCDADLDNCDYPCRFYYFLSRKFHQLKATFVMFFIHINVFEIILYK